MTSSLGREAALTHVRIKGQAWPPAAMEAELGPPPDKRPKRTDGGVTRAGRSEDAPCLTADSDMAGCATDQTACPICLALIPVARIDRHVNTHLDAEEQATTLAVAQSLQTHGGKGTLRGSQCPEWEHAVIENEGDIMCTVDHCRQVVPAAAWAAHLEGHSRELAEALETESRLRLQAEQGPAEGRHRHAAAPHHCCVPRPWQLFADDLQSQTSV